MLDRYLFRTDKLPESAGPDVPRDLAWAVEGYTDHQNVSEDSKIKNHTVSVIIEGLDDPVDDFVDDWEETVVNTDNAVAAPPIIAGVVQESIYQNETGASRVEVILDISGPDDGDYEVVVTPA